MSEEIQQGLQQEIWRWQRCRTRLIEERDKLQQQIVECDRMLSELYRR